jgi:hypothetical protein
MNGNDSHIFSSDIPQVDLNLAILNTMSHTRVIFHLINYTCVLHRNISDKPMEYYLLFMSWCGL